MCGLVKFGLTSQQKLKEGFGKSYKKDLKIVNKNPNQKEFFF